MTCSSLNDKPDWKAYALGELDPEGRRHAEAHAAECPKCREELAMFRLTLDALSTLREEEIPRRIAFVSDKVFEPRWWARWSEGFLRPSFAAACVVAAAILVHAFVRPPAPAGSAALQAAVNTAVTQAVAQVEERHAKEVAAMLSDYDMLSRQVTKMYVVDTGLVRQ